MLEIVVLYLYTVLGQNGSGENGTDKMVADKMVYGQNGMDKTVRIKYCR